MLKIHLKQPINFYCEVLLGRGHIFFKNVKKTQESTSWNATVKPQNNQAELFYLKVCKEVKLASVFNLFKIEKFAVKLSSNILLRIGLWGLPPREAPVVSHNDIM